MTLREGKRKVYELLDEYTSGGAVEIDADLEAKMADLFDLAQKDVAQAKKIWRVANIDLAGGEGIQLYELPEDLFEIARLWINGRETKQYEVIAGKLAADGGTTGTAMLEYAALPKTIPLDADDEYEFEVAEDAAACMPYYVAAQVLLPDLVLDFSPFWQMYLTKRAALIPTVRKSGGGGIRQILFRR